MEKGVLGLNDNEIQEELLNADLKALGITEGEINNMETQEKQNLLTALKQSTKQQQEVTQNKQAPYSNNDDPISCGSSPNPTSVSDKNEIDISIDSPEEYPSLPSPSNKRVTKDVAYVRRNNQYQRPPLRPQQKLPQQQNQYQHPKKQIAEVITVNSNQEESDDEEVEEEDDEEVYEEVDEEEEEDDDDDDQSFNFPNFIDDNGCALKQQARKKPILRYIQYYTLPTQSSRDSVKTMLKHYNAWFRTWCALEKHNILPDGDNSFIANITRAKQDSIPSTSVSPETSISCSSKVTNDTQNNERPAPFGKSSSPDVEEIEVTEIKMAETSRLTPSASTLPRETRGHNVQTPSSSSSPAIALSFEEKWDQEGGSTSRKSVGKRNSMNNRSASSGYASPGKELHFQPKEPPKVEAKVQCPICQLDFLQSKVENHAAVCEGFPSETRSNQPTHSSKIEESNSKDGCTNSTVVELTNSESKVANKKRVAENEDNQTNKRMCVNSIKS